ncbi:triadin-like [Erythrolamprus reginae]|uniref:triadin-like n=1 Tax=Erythrolamprus reginae TaxID=121349 RepID=UPI00396C4B2A
MRKDVSGPVSTTTVIDNKNGTVPVPRIKMSNRSVSEDFATTFSSPAAWLLVAALIVTWSAVAIVIFDLVDYRTLAGTSVNKLTTDPFRIVHSAVEESTNSIYGFLSLLSDLIFADEDENGKGEGEPSLKIRVSNLPFVGKAVEKVVTLQQLLFLLEEMDYLDPFQSGFRPDYSMDTALVSLMDDL